MINIAIDGPAGAGKSTIAKAAAANLGFVYVDTGALYRAIGLYIIGCGIGTKDAAKIETALSGINIKLKFVDGEQRVILNDVDVSLKIRTPEVSMAASDVSAIPCVRAFLFDLQRSIASENNCIMDGRDIGTVVLPNADIKIFLTALPEERARRRYDEFILKGVETTFDEVMKDISQRDYNDANRPIAPLKPAENAIIIDTTGNDLEQSVNIIINTIRERI
ncbi:MAG: (d)CMP kinase [Clostridia bacterium]|nr:(d)CMP kinase [Clostridia bacterium]